MSAPGGASLLVILLTVSVVVKVIDAQGCQDITTCGTNYGPALASAGQDKDKICKAANVYLTCLEAAAKKCSVDVDNTVEPARKALSQAGCSGSGAPVLSFVAKVLGVVISGSF
ncbi:uncharacterized protein LOC134247380 isoform X2 [Saccostrea cucullata]|uniref:uncharacterized protein LOC134247380 isoform X2 n=1 Tax=Saccostrea cuccullata TaxID=36930 RepID=UPI002ED0E627